MSAYSVRYWPIIVGILVSVSGCNTVSTGRKDAQQVGTMPTKTTIRSNETVADKAGEKAADRATDKPVASAAAYHLVAINGLNLRDAVGLAIARHPDISRADAVVARSASEVAIAKAAWYPTIQYSAQPGFGDYQSGSSRSNAIRGSIGMDQQIYDFGRTASSIGAANANLNKQKHLLDDTTEQVAYDAATIFVQLAASQDMLAAAKRQVAALRETRGKIAERATAGLSDASDLNMADVAIQRAEAETLKQQTQFDVAAGKMAELIGARPARVASLNQVGSLVAKLGDGGNSVDQTPSLLAAGAALEEAKAKVKLAKASRYPSLGLGVSQSLSTRKEDDYDNTWVGLRLNGEFSLGGKARHQIDAAMADQQAADQTLENQRRNVRTAMNSAKTEASGAYARAGSYEKVISLAQSSRDLFWQEYTLNKRPLTNVIDAETQVFQSELERSTAVADGILARIRAHVAIGEFVAMLRKSEGKA